MATLLTLWLLLMQNGNIREAAGLLFLYFICDIITIGISDYYG